MFGIWNLVLRISLRNAGSPCLRRAGFPHSEITGSKVVGTSPMHIAANCVLHQPLSPRHPPFASIKEQS